MFRRTSDKMEYNNLVLIMVMGVIILLLVLRNWK